MIVSPRRRAKRRSLSSRSRSTRNSLTVPKRRRVASPHLGGADRRRRERDRRAPVLLERDRREAEHRRLAGAGGADDHRHLVGAGDERGGRVLLGVELGRRASLALGLALERARARGACASSLASLPPRGGGLVKPAHDLLLDFDQRLRGVALERRLAVEPARCVGVVVPGGEVDAEASDRLAREPFDRALLGRAPSASCV